MKIHHKRKGNMQVNPSGFLWPEEKKLVHYLLRVHEAAWSSIEHVPWVLRNIPISPGICDQIIEVIRYKIESGIRGIQLSIPIEVVLCVEERREIVANRTNAAVVFCSKSLIWRMGRISRDKCARVSKIAGWIAFTTFKDSGAVGASPLLCYVQYW